MFQLKYGLWYYCHNISIYDPLLATRRDDASGRHLKQGHLTNISTAQQHGLAYYA